MTALWKQRPEFAGSAGLTAILLALGTSALYGTSDFLAGVLARRVSAVLLALWSQVASGALLLAVVLVSAQRPSFAGLLWGAAAGVMGAAGVLVFYRALVAGPTSLVAPLAASGVALPVLLGIAQGNAPGVPIIAGLVVVLAGLALASLTGGGGDATSEIPSTPVPCKPRPEATPAPTTPPQRGAAIPLALLAAVGFGAFFILLDRGSAAAESGELWATLGVQLGAFLTILGSALVVRGGRSLAVRPLALLLAVAGVGVMEVIGDGFLTYATALGELGVVSVLASLDPVVMVLLAQVIVMERLPRLQASGVGLALVGTLLVASG